MKMKKKKGKRLKFKNEGKEERKVNKRRELTPPFL